MSTAERAAGIADAAAGFTELLGPVTAQDLIEVVQLELGDAEILDGFASYGSHRARVIVPPIILHVVSGNTPHGALQSLIRGLLLGSRNRMKLPSSGLPEVEAFVAALPPELRELVELSTELADAWVSEAGAVVVFGSDQTVAALRKRIPNGVPFQAHGHRVSFGIVFGDGQAAASLAARDVSLFDQRGCLSPHVIYVAEVAGQTARGFAGRLSEEMAAFNAATPRGKLGIGEAAEIVDLRASYAFRSAGDVRVQMWVSQNSTDWTVIFEEDPWFATSPGNRVIFVKPLPATLDSALIPVRPWLAAIGIWPATLENANRVSSSGASRICALGDMQYPPLTWHAEGHGNLGSLITWVDFG